jgi:ferredoxin
MSFLSYSTSGFIACTLAEYIRRLGYPARAHHAMNYRVVVPPILLWAGLGEMCRIGDKVMHNRYKKWPVDVQKCTGLRVGIQHGSGCGACIKVCPWNKPDTSFHRLVNWMVRHIPATRSIVVKADDIMGYGKPKPEWKWWFDLEIADGAYGVPLSRRAETKNKTGK